MCGIRQLGGKGLTSERRGSSIGSGTFSFFFNWCCSQYAMGRQKDMPMNMICTHTSLLSNSAEVSNLEECSRCAQSDRQPHSCHDPGLSKKLLLAIAAFALELVRCSAQRTCRCGISVCTIVIALPRAEALTIRAISRQFCSLSILQRCMCLDPRYYMHAQFYAEVTPIFAKRLVIVPKNNSPVTLRPVVALILATTQTLIQL